MSVSNISIVSEEILGYDLASPETDLDLISNMFRSFRKRDETSRSAISAFFDAIHTRPDTYGLRTKAESRSRSSQ